MNKHKQFIKEETWRPVFNYESSYEVSNLGRVRSIKRDVTHSRNDEFTRSVSSKILSQSLNPQGYYKVRLSFNGVKKTKLVHHLVAESFLNHTKRSHNVCVDHIDENPKNNCLSNLQIISKQANTKKSFDSKINSINIGEYWFHSTGVLELVLDVTKYHGGTVKTNAIHNCITENKFSYHGISTMDRKATEKEVEEALIKEAKRRGFGKGVSFCNSMLDECDLKECTPINNEFKLEAYDYCYKNYLSIDGYMIFGKGKWAEIINKKKLTVSQIEKELGYQIEVIAE